MNYGTAPNGQKIIVEDPARRCPWCDGTGVYARTETLLVPCGQCDATGVKR